jgi:hypothetical protein
MGVVGCISRIPDYGRAAERIEEAFPAFAELGVRELVVRDSRDGPMTGCAYIDYERGRFATGKRCKSLFWDRPTPGELDEQAWLDMERLREALDDPDDGYWSAQIDYRSDGAIQAGSFTVDSCGTHKYDPDYGELPETDSMDAIDVNDDWYVITSWPFDFISGC